MTIAQHLRNMSAPNPCCGCQPFGIAVVTAASQDHALNLIKRARKVYVRVPLTDSAADNELFQIAKPQALRVMSRPTFSGKTPAVRLHLGTHPKLDQFASIGA